MKKLLWVVVLYEASVGISEILWTKLNSPKLAKIASLPSVASLADKQIVSAFSGNANNIEGAIDLAIAAMTAIFIMY